MAVTLKIKKRKNGLGLEMPSVRKNFKYKRIMEMGPDKVITLEHQLINGVSSNDMAVIIKDEWGHFDEIQHDTLARLLRSYKAVVLMPKLLAATQGLSQHTKEKAQKSLEEQRNVSAEFDYMIERQRDRVEMALRMEKDLRLPTQTASRELRLFKDMCRDLGRFQIQMGLVRKFEDGGVINLNMHQSIQQLNFKAINTAQVAEATQKAYKVLEEMGGPVIDTKPL